MTAGSLSTLCSLTVHPCRLSLTRSLCSDRPIHTSRTHLIICCGRHPWDVIPWLILDTFWIMAFSARLRQSWAVFLFVFFLQTFFLRPCMSSAPTPEFVKAFNNTADGNSSITWGPLPAGEPYLTDTNYDEGGLGPYHQCVRNFLDVVQPNDVPYGN